MKGLSFSEPMVKAWLEGRKTVTRRMGGLNLINKSPDEWCIMSPMAWMAPTNNRPALGGSPKNCGLFFNLKTERGIAIPFRYLPGETVYIKETWWGRNPSGTVSGKPEVYHREHGDILLPENKWQSPRFMPEWASRSHALIVSVRPERVQEITEEEARNEGVIPFHLDPEGDCWTDGKYRTAFEHLWNELHGWNPNSFASNPWVWRIELEKKP